MNKDEIAVLVNLLGKAANSVAVVSGCDANLTVAGRSADALTTLSAENEAQATRIEALEAALDIAQSAIIHRSYCVTESGPPDAKCNCGKDGALRKIQQALESKP